jgi:predicted  nucleic acid-binding Zn-ribbon protein
MPEHDELKALERLEERIVQTVMEVKAARDEKARAEKEAAGLRERVAVLEDERRQILDRIEKLLARIDTLAEG